MIIGKLIFSNVLGYYGLELCLKNIKKTVYIVNNKTASACDLLLVSLFYYRDILYLENFIRKTDLTQTTILAGGMQATITPQLIAEMVDYVFIGDGEEHLENIINEYINNKTITNKYVYHKNMETVPKPAIASKIKPFAYFHSALKSVNTYNKRKKGIQQSRMKKMKSLYRIEISRGCKFKCPFCVMSSLKPYREANYQDIKSVLNDIPFKKVVSIFAPDRASHSKWDQISSDLKNYIDIGQDVRIEKLNKIESESATVGIEGPSARLRKLVKKYYSNEFILEKIKQFCTTGKRKHWGAKLTLYFIADLPTETWKDYDDIKELFVKLSEAQWSRHLILHPVLNPLSPKPYTALYDAEIHPFRNYDKYWKTLLRGGTGNGRWGIKIVEHRIWLPFERILDAIIHQGKIKAYNTINKLPKIYLTKIPYDWNKSYNIGKQILDLASKNGLNKKQLFKTDNLY